MILIIAEKHSMAKNIAEALGSGKSANGYIECKDYLVSWAQGHLIDLVTPDGYPQWAGAWKVESLPMIPREWLWESSSTKGAKAQFKVLCELMKRPDVTSVINACDADREGEGIFRRIYAKAGCKKPVKRFWNTTPVDDAILKDLVGAKPSQIYDGLGAAAEGRAKADWLVGLNASRAYSCLYHDNISAGRVQTPLLSMIVERTRQVEAFKSSPFWQVRANVGEFSLFSERYENRQLAESDLNQVIAAGYATVKRAEYKQERMSAPALYDLTTLQREASRRCGLPADQTLAAAQTLYEKKLATYPRTDSRFITTEDMSEAKALLPLIARADVVGSEVAEAFNPARANVSRIVNDKKVSGHTALMPTKLANAEAISELASAERKVFLLIACRLLAAVMEPASIAKAKIEADIAGIAFSASGSRVVDEAWQAVDTACKKAVKGTHKTEDEENSAESDEKRQNIPAQLHQGQKLEVVAADIKEGKTTPPKLYTFDTLLAAMENAGRTIDDATLKQAINDDSSHSAGLGTPATRAGIIKSLIDKDYAALKSKTTIIATPKGMTLIDLVQDDLKSPELTARWEYELSQVEKGQKQLDVFLDGIEGFTRQLVDSARDGFDPSVDTKAAARVVVGACPTCGENVIKTGSVFQCETNKSEKDESGRWVQREGCGFKLFPTVASKKLTDSQVERILAGKTVPVKGLKSKKGTKFDAGLKLGADGRIEFVFDGKPAGPGKGKATPAARKPRSSSHR